MPRRREIPKREVLPDPKFHNGDVAKFINVLMTRGKKSTAERIVYGALEMIKSSPKTGRGVHAALQNVKPVVEVKSRRVGGANYRVPVEVRPCVAWRYRCAGSARRHRSAAKSMRARLAGELAEAAEGRGGAMKKRRKCIAWRRPTRPLALQVQAWNDRGPQDPNRTLPEHGSRRTSTPARPRPSASSLHGREPQTRRGARRRGTWTDGAGTGARHHALRPRPRVWKGKTCPIRASINITTARPRRFHDRSRAACVY